MTNEGFLNLMEAIMEQAYKDANEDNKDEALKAEAKAYIEKMKNAFAKA